MKKTLLFLLSVIFIKALGQTNEDRLILGKRFAETTLREALAGNSGHNYVDNVRTIITDSLTATKVAEAILFSIYGQDNIKRQRPYEIHHLDNYWLMTGTLPKGRLGGTFLIILDSRDSRIIRLTHGK